MSRTTSTLRRFPAITFPTCCGHVGKVKTCYWARPEKYAHIALGVVRRLDIVWTDEEVPDYDKLIQMSKDDSEEKPKFVKDILRRHTKKT